ncbi:hypothetical protein HDU97_001559 [Phlyctochytrium planicorne]|nr:hypothetical protein HDU97_001559 [Phlyctochytrium planicorne]
MLELTNLPPEILNDICMRINCNDLLSVMLTSRCMLYSASRIRWKRECCWNYVTAETLYHFLNVVTSEQPNDASNPKQKFEKERITHYLASIRMAVITASMEDPFEKLLVYLKSLEEIRTSPTYLFESKALQEFHASTGQPSIMNVQYRFCMPYPKLKEYSWGWVSPSNILSMPDFPLLKTLSMTIDLPIPDSIAKQDPFEHVVRKCPNLTSLTFDVYEEYLPANTEALSDLIDLQNLSLTGIHLMGTASKKDSFRNVRTMVFEKTKFEPTALFPTMVQLRSLILVEASDLDWNAVFVSLQACRNLEIVKMKCLQKGTILPTPEFSWPKLFALELNNFSVTEEAGKGLLRCLAERIERLSLKGDCDDAVKREIAMAAQDVERFPAFKALNLPPFENKRLERRVRRHCNREDFTLLLGDRYR